MKKNRRRVSTAPSATQFRANPFPVPSEYSLLNFAGCGCRGKRLSISSYLSSMRPMKETINRLINFLTLALPEPSSETSLSIRSLLEFGGCKCMVLTEPLVTLLECAVLKKVSYPAPQRPHAPAYQFQRTLTVQIFISSLLEFAGCCR